MRTPQPPDGLTLATAFVAVAAVAAELALGQHSSPPTAPTFSRLGPVAGGRPPVSLGRRLIVVLRTPSLAERVARARFATSADERRWTTNAYAAQQRVLTLAVHGLGVHPDYSFARVLDGFSASLDPRAVAWLNADPEIRGVYPVRAAFPASVSSQQLSQVESSSQLALRGFDGRGVTIALLDTAVDRSSPFLGGRVSVSYDVVGAQAEAQGSSRHATDLAGVLVGAGGPDALHGAAAGAKILPIRVAGPQPDGVGHELVYARSDQLIAGLERAVDPNGDGVALDAVRIALLGVAEPYAAFADSPEALAVSGAVALDTLVVAPAGNDGVGSVAGPGGAPDALAVGASDGRAIVPTVRVVLRAGLRIVFDGRLPLLGGDQPAHALDLSVGVPSGNGASLGRFFAAGLSLVAGRAALLAGRDDPAAAAGANAVLLYGAAVPGPLDLPGPVGVPVVGVPAEPALALLSARKLGRSVGVSLDDAPVLRNGAAGRIAGFSSRGHSFDGRVKPDLIAPGVGLPTSSDARGQVFAAVTGTSAAAASVAGAAALLAQARPGLDARGLRSLLAGYTRDGQLSLGRSAAGELVTDPTSLAFESPGLSETIVLRNVSRRPLRVEALSPGGRVAVVPHKLLVGVGRQASIRVTLRVGPGPVTGAIRLVPDGGEALRVPWATDPRHPPTSLLGRITLRSSRFSPSDTSPTLLDLQLDGVRWGEIEAVSKLELSLYDAAGRPLGLLARQRDLLPGTYRFGLSGRGPSGARLRPGRYELRLTAWPTLPGRPPSLAVVRFEIQ